MRQLTQKLKNGDMKILEVAPPVLGSGMLLVRNHYSLISAGTEGSTVTAARKSLIGKAKERPQQVKQVIDTLRQQGPVLTFRAVMKKLDSYSPLGYSCAGEVLEVAPDVKGFVPGDLVACAGLGYACHAELVAVPVNLCVKLPQGADLKRAAYNTLGAIALQGVRQADLRFGESCAVIGLGLLGQLSGLLLRAGGIKVIGVDIDPVSVATASKHCADFAFTRDTNSLAERIGEISDGIGVDAVIITAATSSSDPINFAGRIARKKAKIIIVGNVPTNFDREPYFYKKELEVKMSCSYGPGRYDINYEEKGLDYPAAYVRWTENRNMHAFQQAIHSGRVDMDYLSTHVFPLDQAPEAYNLILGRNEPFLGILIEYHAEQVRLEKKIATGQRSGQGKVNVAFAGAGSYALSHLLPNIPKTPEVCFKGVMTSSGASSRTVADKFKFEFCTADAKDIFENDDINTVFIATRHNTHAPYLLSALHNGKNVFVEKPLCLKEGEFSELTSAYYSANPHPLVMIGFNRRFAPLVTLLKQKIGDGPMSMLYRINAGTIPPDSWIQDREIGGGRILGEVCHFVDLLTFVNGSLPTQVFASALPDAANLSDTISVTLVFANGSVGSLCYFSNGPKSLEKEYLEIYRAGTTAILRDFKSLEVFGSGSTFSKKLLSQDKGQSQMVAAFIDAVRNGTAAPISFEEMCAVTSACFKIVQSLQTKSAVSL